MKLRGDISSNQASRTAILGALTDYYFVPRVVKMLPMHVSRFKRFVSMNHHIWFHDPSPDVHGWLFTRQKAWWAAEGRLLLEQHIWSEKGVLILSCTQEALLKVGEAEKGPKI